MSAPARKTIPTPGESSDRNSCHVYNRLNGVYMGLMIQALDADHCEIELQSGIRMVVKRAAILIQEEAPKKGKAIQERSDTNRRSHHDRPNLVSSFGKPSNPNLAEEMTNPEGRFGPFLSNFF